MTLECHINDLADAIQSRLTQGASLMSPSMTQSVTVTLTDATRQPYEVLNSQQSLFKLPNELLANIARDLLSCPMGDISDTDKRPLWRSTVVDPMILFPVMHTCRRFRQVIIADTTLWRHLTIRNRHFVDLSLSRCGPTQPLTLWLSPRILKPMPLTDFHFQLVPRLQELHFHKCIPKNFSGLNRFLLLPFPHLESFSWTGEMTTRDWSGWHDGMLPSSGLTTPNLRYMHVQQMRMLLPTTDVPRLTHLCISSFTDSALPSLVSNVLQHCPALTSLVLRKLRSRGWLNTNNVSNAQPLRLPHLSRVVLADMEFPDIQHFTRLFASPPVPCMQIILTDDAGPLYAYEGEFFASLYLQYWLSTHPTDTPRLSVTAHTSEDYPSSTGLSITLANSTHVLHISLAPKFLEWDLRRSGGRRWSDWRVSLLTPLRALPDLREVWLADMHVDTFMPVDALPFAGVPGEAGRQLGYGLAPVQAQAAARQARVPGLDTIVVVYNCSARGCRNSLSIRPTLIALPKCQPRARADQKSPSESRSESQSASDSPPSGTAPPPLAHLILAVGYDTSDEASLHDTWQSALLPGGKGQVEVSAKLLREAASDEYAFVRHAALRVQLMPHLALAPGELDRLRECFASVEVEDVERVPRVPVPGCVRDEVLVLEAFVPGSVLC